MKLLCCAFLWLSIVLVPGALNGQPADPYPFGQVSVLDFGRTYEKDTTASAIVLMEHGYSFVQDYDNFNLVHIYHVKLRILKKSGLEKANVMVPLSKWNSKKELCSNVRAASYRIEQGVVKTTAMSPKAVVTENANENYDAVKFSIPDVAVGNVIEYSYEVETPFFVSAFYPWEFQSDIPKIMSEYTAVVPGNYRYNILLVGLLPLARKDSDIKRECFRAGGGVADCSRYTWAMENIPPFIEEEYMTSRKNYLSAVRFELLQIDYFDGRKDKVTKEWKDVEGELRQDQRFGVQLRRGGDILSNEVSTIIAGESDPLARAKAIFNFIRGWYRWDRKNGKYSEFGIRRAFERREGNSGDINLSLVAAMREAQLDAEPVILSTREHGWPTDLYPVLNDFNYVICKVNIGEKAYLLDATNDYLPFGMLPLRCLNGRGRVIGEKGSYWYDIKPVDKNKLISTSKFVIGADGNISGTIRHVYMGYLAADKRAEILALNKPEDYANRRKSSNGEWEISDVALENLEDDSKPLAEVITVSQRAFDPVNERSFMLNPFPQDRWMKNPFRSQERTYPVDFGIPIDETIVVELELPPGIEVEELPGKVGLALPNSGGRLLYEVKRYGNKLSLSSNLLVGRTLFSPEEYHYLKELFNQRLKLNSNTLIFRRSAAGQ